MNRTVALFALAAGLLLPAGFAQSTRPEKPSGGVTCPATATLEELIKALDEGVSGPADKDRTCLRKVLYPNARLIPVGRTREGTFAPHVLSVDEWIEAVQKRGHVPLYEKQIKVKAETYGHIAHLWSTYEIRATPDGKANLRGINSIQASFDGTSWKVMEILWEAETPSEKIPEKYLP
jgi:hypothetical protein